MGSSPIWGIYRLDIYFKWQEVRIVANLPVIDMVRTGQNIGRLRKQAGLSVKDL